MNIIYKRILNLTVGHEYFVDGYDRFVNISPTAETSILLKNGNILFKKLPHGITLLYRAQDDESTPVIDLSRDQKFVFGIKSDNSAGLQNVTNFDESVSKPFRTGNILLFKNNPANASTNKNNPEILMMEIIDSLRSRLFTYRFKISGNPLKVKMVVTNESGNPVSVGVDGNGDPLAEILPVSINSSDYFEQQIDLGKYKKGQFLITILNDAETITLKQEKIYADELLEKQNILGVIDIKYESSSGHLYGETEEYKLQFVKAETAWKYFIVNKSRNIDLSSESLKIVDAGSTNGSPYSVNDFSRAFASIQLTAKNPGTSGNSITLEYSGGSFPALYISGKTLSGGTTGTEAKGTLTIINNSVTGYTISIGGIDFTEGSEFSNGSTPADTANNLVTAINNNGSVQVTASPNNHDILVNDMETLVFNSEQDIPFFEKPKLNIELQQTSNNEKVIANLPNPSPAGLKKSFAGRDESEVYVFI